MAEQISNNKKRKRSDMVHNTNTLSFHHWTAKEDIYGIPGFSPPLPSVLMDLVFESAAPLPRFRMVFNGEPSTVIVEAQSFAEIQQVVANPGTHGYQLLGIADQLADCCDPWTVEEVDRSFLADSDSLVRRNTIMGNCYCQPRSTMQTPVALDMQIDNKLEQDAIKEKMTPRVLLLGPGESGKTTIVTHLVRMYSPISLELSGIAGSAETIRILHSNISECLQSLESEVNRVNPKWADEHPEYTELVFFIRGLKEQSVPHIPLKRVTLIQKLLKTIAFQDALHSRNKFWILCNRGFILDDSKMNAICDPEFKPNDEDRLMARVRTTGIQESLIGYHKREASVIVATSPGSQDALVDLKTNSLHNASPASPASFATSASPASSASPAGSQSVPSVPSTPNTIQTQTLNESIGSLGVMSLTKTPKPFLTIITDVGGQRIERKKWISCFDRVSAVIYVVSLQGFNKVLMEDSSANTMCEAIALFKLLFNTRKEFRNTPVSVFFNQYDLYVKELVTNGHQIKDSVGADGKMLFDGSDKLPPKNPLAGIEYFANIFREQLPKSRRSEFCYDVLTATEANEVDRAYLGFRATILETILERKRKESL